MSLFDRAVVNSLPLVPGAVLRKFASRYVAGETLAEALGVVARLNAEGACATLDVLGEDVTRREECEGFVAQYLEAMRQISSSKLDSNISVKLSAMGLRIDPELAQGNLRRLLEEARRLSMFVRIDMEDSTLTQPTIDQFTRVRRDFDNVGIVLQAYLRRTQADVALAVAQRWNVRICKGIYVESPRIAYRDPDLIRRNYAFVTDRMLAAGIAVGIATHDEAMVVEALHSIERHAPPPASFEFQMLLGVAPGLRNVLIAAGHRLRVYVPYGRAWRAYSTRRLKENPAIARHVLKGMFRRKEAL